MLLRLALAASLLSVGVSHADSKFTHSAEVKPDVKLTEKSRPTQKKDTGGRPALTAAEILAVEGLLGPLEEEKIALLDDLIKKTPDTDLDEKAEYMHRLATIYAKRQRFHRIKSIENEIAAQTATAKAKPALVAKQKEHAKQAHQALLDSIGAYQLLINDPKYVNTPMIDTAIFYYAYTLQSANYLKEARDAYDKLLKNYPKSKYIPEAHLAFAEHYFEARQLADAAHSYNQVLRFPKSSVYRYAQYKLGWVDYNLRKFTEAMQAFNDVAQATRNDPDKAVLHRASKQDFVRAYAEVGKADKALHMFKRVDHGGDGLGMLATLADLYIDQGKPDKAIFVYRQLMTEKPTSPNVCYWQHQVTRSMLTAGQGDDKIREIEQLVKLYSAVKTKLPKAELIECRDAAAEMSGELAKAFHEEAFKTKNRDLAGYARRLYRTYLAGFADASNFSEMIYYHAELSWLYAEWETDARLATQKWEDAANAFTDAMDRGKLSPKLTQVSADAAMLAWMKTLHVDPTIKREPVDEEATYKKIPQPKSLGAREAKLLAAYELYLKYVKDPNDSERVDVLVHEANLYRRFDHLEKAIALFEQVATKHPKHEAAEWAAQMVLDSYNRLQRYPAMFAFADKLPKAFLADHQELAKTIAKLRKQAVRKEAEALEEEAKKTGSMAKFVECGDKYLRAYNDDPLADDAGIIIYNSGVCFEQGKSLSAAKIAYLTLQEHFPKSEQAKKSIARLGNVYASIAYYREAAEKYEDYATRFAGEKDALSLFSTAVQFRKGIGDDAMAIADTNKFIVKFGKQKPVVAADAFFSMIGIYEKQGDLDKLARHLREYIDRYGAIGGADRRIIANAKLGQALWQSACPVSTVDGTCMKMQREASFSRKLKVASKTIGVPKRCGEETIAEFTMVARDERRLKLAMGAFDAAIAEFEKVKAAGGNDKDSVDARGALYHFALARFGKLERDYEKYLALPIPAGLDFDTRKPAVAEKSQKRFDTWFIAKRDAGVNMRKQYEEVIGLKDGAVAIAAAARTGSILQNFSAQLYRAEIPADVRSGPYAADGADAYCDKLEKVAEPLAIGAEAFYEGCLKTSTRLGWFSEWSRACERELGQLKPGTYPQVFELRRTADSYATIVDTEGAPTL